jgi:ActR/RegA family two-component response regulator
VRTLEDTASDWLRHERDHGSYLYRGFRLEEAEKLEGRLSKLGVEFLNASRRSKRKRQLLVWSSITLAILALVLGLGYLAKAEADARELRALHRLEEVQKKSEMQRLDSQKRIEAERIRAATAYGCAVRAGCSAETLNSIKATVSKSERKLVYVHIVNESQRAFAKRLQGELGNGYLVLGVEKRPEVRRQSLVLYFHQSDSDSAEALKDKLRTLPGMQNARAMMIKGYEEKVPLQQFEIWMSPTAGSESGATEQR